MEKTKRKKDRLLCSKCNSKNIYSLKDGTIVCRKCGYRRKK
jgi:transcription initiation factor TFIIIB Brf1 subunit/transcription initiation factor TFIIB